MTKSLSLSIMSLDQLLAMQWPHLRLIFVLNRLLASAVEHLKRSQKFLASGVTTISRIIARSVEASPKKPVTGPRTRPSSPCCRRIVSKGPVWSFPVP